MDVLGHLPRTTKGNKYVLVVGDYLTKYTDAIPMRDQEAITIANKLVERIFSIHGLPYQLYTDKGTNFQSLLMKELCQLLDIQKKNTIVFMPSSDGMVERANFTIAHMLSKFVCTHQTDWDQYIHLLMLAYRSSEHETTGVSPNEMLYGHHVTLPVDLILGKPEYLDRHDQYATDCVYDLSAKLESIHEFARANMRLSADKMKNRHDLKAENKTYSPGDLVWMHHPHRKKEISPKLQIPWDGPFQVVSRLNSVVYKIRRNSKSKPKITHYNKLKPYLGTQVFM